MVKRAGISGLFSTFSIAFCLSFNINFLPNWATCSSIICRPLEPISAVVPLHRIHADTHQVVGQSSSESAQCLLLLEGRRYDCYWNCSKTAFLSVSVYFVFFHQPSEVWSERCNGCPIWQAGLCVCSFRSPSCYSFAICPEYLCRSFAMLLHLFVDKNRVGVLLMDGKVVFTQ